MLGLQAETGAALVDGQAFRLIKGPCTVREPAADSLALVCVPNRVLEVALVSLAGGTGRPVTAQ